MKKISEPKKIVRDTLYGADGDSLMLVGGAFEIGRASNKKNSRDPSFFVLFCLFASISLC